MQPSSKRLVKRAKGSDTWVNSGGKRGGRDLLDANGVAVVRRRYGTIVAKSGPQGAAALRYQQYTLIRNGEEDMHNRVFYVHGVEPAKRSPRQVDEAAPEVPIKQEEQAEAAQPQAEPVQEKTDAARVVDMPVAVELEAAAQSDVPEYIMALHCDMRQSTLSVGQAVRLILDPALQNQRPGTLVLTDDGAQPEHLSLFKETAKQRRSAKADRWAISGGVRAARDLLFEASVTLPPVWAEPNSHGLESETPRIIVGVRRRYGRILRSGSAATSGLRFHKYTLLLGPEVGAPAIKMERPRTEGGTQSAALAASIGLIEQDFPALYHTSASSTKRQATESADRSAKKCRVDPSVAAERPDAVGGRDAVEAGQTERGVTLRDSRAVGRGEPLSGTVTFGDSIRAFSCRVSVCCALPFVGTAM